MKPSRCYATVMGDCKTTLLPLNEEERTLQVSHGEVELYSRAGCLVRHARGTHCDSADVAHAIASF